MKPPPFALLTLVLVACGPVTPQPAPFLRALRDAPSPKLSTMLEDQVQLHTGAGVTSGPTAVMAALLSLEVGADALLEAHHDVARLSPSNGSLLFAVAGSDGRVSRVLAFSPTPTAPASGVLLAYAESWNLTSGPDRAANLASLWTSDGRYVDPKFDTRGRDGLANVIDTFHASFPGSTLVAGPAQVMAAGGFTFDWTMTVPQGDPLVGFDVGLLDASDAITLISGFYTAR